MNAEQDSTLSKKLLKLRKGKGLTQEDLAEQLQVSRQSVSRWELGTAFPTPAKLHTLAQLYGISVDFLLDEDCQEYEKEAEIQADPVSTSPPPQKASHLFSLFLSLIILVLAILLSAVLIVAHSTEEKSTSPIPIQELPTIKEDSYPIDTFLIE